MRSHPCAAFTIQTFHLLIHPYLDSDINLYLIVVLGTVGKDSAFPPFNKYSWSNNIDNASCPIKLASKRKRSYCKMLLPLYRPSPKTQAFLIAAERLLPSSSNMLINAHQGIALTAPTLPGRPVSVKSGSVGLPHGQSPLILWQNLSVRTP